MSILFNEVQCVSGCQSRERRWTHIVCRVSAVGRWGEGLLGFHHLDHGRENLEDRNIGEAVRLRRGGCCQSLLPLNPATG